MNIVVCVKQVPDTLEVSVNAETNTLIREGIDGVINPFDLYAVEEALRLKEQYGGVVTVLSMGPAQVIETLRQAMCLGAERGILLSDIGFAGADTLATSYTLARAVKKIGHFDFIICGRQAIDGDTAQVGPEIAAWLNIPQITCVSKILEIDEKRIKVERLTDYGYDIIETTLPCVITVNKEINEPRLPSLRGMMKAKKFKAQVWDSNSMDVDKKFIGLEGSPTRVVKIFAPPQKKGGEKHEGTPEELASIIARKFEEMKLI